MIGSGCAEEARLDMQSFAGRTWAWAPELGSQSAAAELPNVCVCNLTQHKAVTAGEQAARAGPRPAFGEIRASASLR